MGCDGRALSSLIEKGRTLSSCSSSNVKFALEVSSGDVVAAVAGVMAGGTLMPSASALALPRQQDVATLSGGRSPSCSPNR